MKRFLPSLIGALIVLVPGAFAQSPYGYAGPDSIPWRTYKMGRQDTISTPRQVVMIMQSQWRNYWRELTGADPNTAPTDVDFTREQLVGISLGERRTGGYDVYVESVRRVRPGETVINFAESVPPPGSFNAQMITRPWVVIRMPRETGIVSFSKRTVISRPPIAGRFDDCSCRCCSACGCGFQQPVVLGYEPFSVPNLGNSLDPFNNIQWSTYRSGMDSKIDGFETRVMENEADWQMYWSRLTGNPASTAPRDIDWVKRRVVAINLGEKPSAGYSTYVETVERKRASEIEITFVSKIPPKGQPSAAVMTSPYVVITMDRVAGNFTFRQKELRTRVYTLPKCKCGCSTCGCKHGM